LARPLLKLTELTVLPPDFLNSGGDSNHDVGSPFHHFGRFFVFISFDERIRPGAVTSSCPHTHSPPVIFFLPTFCSLGERNNENARLHHSLDWMG
jgi:hypothetical protein